MKKKLSCVALIKKVKIIDWIIMVLSIIFFVHFDADNFLIIDAFYLSAIIIWAINFCVRMFLIYSRSGI